MPFTAFRRFGPTSYSDGVSLPRGGLASSTLPSARAVSVAVHQGLEREKQTNISISLMVMQFGQFLDHDLDLTADQSRRCCDPAVLSMEAQQPEELRLCFNIDVTDDIFYQGKRTCLPFTRSDATCTESGQREQFNLITAFIDGNNVYGSDGEKARKLRTMKDGLLKTHSIGPTLPSNGQTGFAEEDNTSENLVAGDTRASEQPGLASMHSLFLLEHNRIAREYKSLDPALSDDELYNMTRRLVIAEIQNIVYSEFLPVVLGPDIMDEFNLTLPSSGTTTYNRSVDPSIYNEFATFAFRFGHSLIPNFFEPSNKPRRTVRNVFRLKDNFFKVEEFVIGFDSSGKAWQNLLLGIGASSSPVMDAKLERHITNYLFCGKNCDFTNGFGQDLAARNIQRGRDHGLPGYTKYRCDQINLSPILLSAILVSRELCGLSVPLNWEGKPEDFHQQNWDNIRSVYTNVEDIDAFTGAMSETSVPRGLVGGTIACVLGNQFQNLMKGDRFFFTHRSKGIGNEKGLPPDLRSYALNRTLTDIICDNIEGSDLE